MVHLRVGDAREIDTAWSIWCEANVATQLGQPADDQLGRMQRRLLLPTTALYFLEDDGDAIAVALLSQARERGGAGGPIDGLGHISTVAVRPNYWGRGFATTLIREALEEARRRFYRRVQLWVHASNQRAIGLYQHLGFEKTNDTQPDDFGRPLLRYEIGLTGFEPATP